MNYKWLVGALAVALAATLTPDWADAKRLGGGKNTGMQRQAPAQTTPQNTPPTPAQPATATQPGAAAANPATAGAAAAAAAPAKRSWLGPVAGLAAGLGLAALASHLGFGEELASFMMLALLALVAFFVIRFIMARMAAGRAQPAMAGAGAGSGASSGAAPWAQAPQTAQPAPQPAVEPMARAATPVAGGDHVSVTGVPLAPIGAAATATVQPAVATGPQLPDGFDLPAFERAAKMIFIRLQAANDGADLDDLREFTTPEMFAAIRLEIQERGGAAQETDVEKVDAELVDFVQEPNRQIASVRFHGLVREEKDAPAVAFDEVWHLVKPVDGSRPWAIAGIQQPE